MQAARTGETVCFYGERQQLMQQLQTEHRDPRQMGVQPTDRVLQDVSRVILRVE